MSGGVDSSVAAYLLKEQGYEVTGLSFELWDSRDLEPSNICCSVETVNLARSVAQTLDIRHYSVDVRDNFYKNVIENFCESYIAGATPNPCILCNKFIKFDFLMQKAKELGADIISTGHYAIAETLDGKTADAAGSKRVLLKKGIDPVKDQSYALHVISRQQLQHTVFPLGKMEKKETREIALKLGLATALRPESQDICFVGNGRYTEFIKESAPESLTPGRILDLSGNTIGRHKGIAFYTIGQRRGLGISAPEPHYVIRINPTDNTITAGSHENTMEKELIISDINWLSIDSLNESIKVNVKIRSMMKEKPATIFPAANGSVKVIFEAPESSPAPGQSAVFYDGNIVLGGGIIT